MILNTHRRVMAAVRVDARTEELNRLKEVEARQAALEKRSGTRSAQFQTVKGERGELWDTRRTGSRGRTYTISASLSRLLPFFYTAAHTPAEATPLAHAGNAKTP